MPFTDGGVALMAAFVSALTKHYGAAEIRNQAGHRQFTNPWATQGGDPGCIYILRSGSVRFGSSPTRSNPMSQRMIVSIAARQQRKPGQSPTYPVRDYPSA